MAEIDKDLVRWTPRRWMLMICAALGAQVAMIVYSSRELPNRIIYPREPELTFNSGGGSGMERRWLELEDPFLFASANWKGASGEAWLRKPEWRPPRMERPVPPRFLGLEQAAGSVRRETPQEPFPLGSHRRPSVSLGEIVLPDQAVARSSTLSIEGFGGRSLASELQLPIQYHNDYVSASVVEAVIDRDGLVVSAKIIERSGSLKADADAVELARKVRFAPAPGEDHPIEIGKLIFQWHALDLSSTNNVRR